MQMSTVDEFNNWKEELENKTHSRFIKRRTGISKRHTSTEYVCFRSGNYVRERKGLRSLKTKGTCKINGFCPASIKFIKFNNSADV